MESWFDAENKLADTVTNGDSVAPLDTFDPTFEAKIIPISKNINKTPQVTVELTEDQKLQRYQQLIEGMKNLEGTEKSSVFQELFRLANQNPETKEDHLAYIDELINSNFPRNRKDVEATDDKPSFELLLKETIIKSLADRINLDVSFDIPILDIEDRNGTLRLEVDGNKSCTVVHINFNLRSNEVKVLNVEQPTKNWRMLELQITKSISESIYKVISTESTANDLSSAA